MGQEQYTLSHMVKILRFLSMKNYNHCTRLVAEFYEHGENENIYMYTIKQNGSFCSYTNKKYIKKNLTESTPGLWSITKFLAVDIHRRKERLN